MGYVSERMPLEPRGGANLTSLVNRVLDHALAPGASMPSSDLHHRMRELCAEARAHDVRAEELILLFKKTWATRPELRSMSREEAGRLFDAVLTTCLDAYYADTR